MTTPRRGAPGRPEPSEAAPIRAPAFPCRSACGPAARRARLPGGQRSAVSGHPTAGPGERPAGSAQGAALGVVRSSWRRPGGQQGSGERAVVPVPWRAPVAAVVVAAAVVGGARTVGGVASGAVGGADRDAEHNWCGGGPPSPHRLPPRYVASSAWRHSGPGGITGPHGPGPRAGAASVRRARPDAFPRPVRITAPRRTEGGSDRPSVVRVHEPEPVRRRPVPGPAPHRYPAPAGPERPAP
jgi:hypothetical protein